MSRRVRSILLIAALAAIILIGILPLLRNRPIERVPPPLPSEQVIPPGASKPGGRTINEPR